MGSAGPAGLKRIRSASSRPMVSPWCRNGFFIPGPADERAASRPPRARRATTPGVVAKEREIIQPVEGERELEQVLERHLARRLEAPERSQGDPGPFGQSGLLPTLGQPQGLGSGGQVLADLLGRPERKPVHGGVLRGRERDNRYYRSAKAGWEI